MIDLLVCVIHIFMFSYIHCGEWYKFRFLQNVSTIDDNILSTVLFDPNFGEIHYNEGEYVDVSPIEETRSLVYDEVNKYLALRVIYTGVTIDK